MPPTKTLFLILLPMVAAFAGHRLYLHLVRVQHIYPGGYLLHHLFTGVLILIPAAFVLAFGPRHRWSAVLALVALGVGSGMVLDEVTYLVITRATDDDYVSPVSLWGAVVLVSVATLLLVGLYSSHRRTEPQSGQVFGTNRAAHSESTVESGGSGVPA